MMNERIQKLLLELDSPVGRIGNWGRVEWADNVYPQLGDDLYAKVDLEKFVELIVRECSEICINENVSNLDLNVMQNSGKFTVQDLATKSCGENLAKRIKEHFGVKK
jgi:hypothetical protein